jgi:hypothetical protein
MTEVSVHLPRQFTRCMAIALHRLASRVPPGTTVDLDFSGVRDCQDLALLLLARDVIAGTGHFVFHGLTHHLVTLFGYLGVEAHPAIEVETN